MELCNDRRGRFDHMEYPSTERVLLIYELPLAEIVFDFYDQLKSRTRGLRELRLRPRRLPRGRARPPRRPRRRRAGRRALARPPPRRGYARGRALVDRLREEIPRQMFDVPVQAAIGSRIIARETIKAKRKDVIAKCYGGDITRKRKLLEKQKAGKKRMKQVGAVEVPQEAFLAVLNLDEAARSERLGSPPLRARAVLRAPLRLLRLRDRRRARRDARALRRRAAGGARARARGSSPSRSRRSSSAAARRPSPRPASSAPARRRCRPRRR